jgi:Icc-related predicted phosphoesterase
LLAGDIAGFPDFWKIGRARGMADKSFIPPGKDPKKYYRELLRPAVERLREVDGDLKPIRDRLPVYAIYGNSDLRSVVKEVQPRNFDVIHNKIRERDGIYVVGYNGHPMYPWEMKTPSKKDIFGYTFAETAKEINSFREDDIYEDLMSLCRPLPSNRVIVLTHTPPYRILDKVKPELISWAKSSYGEMANEGNVGSMGLRKLILDYEPIVSIFGHIHESRGIERVDGTTCVNTGSFDERKEFLSVRIESGKAMCEFEKLS